MSSSRSLRSHPGEVYNPLAGAWGDMKAKKVPDLQPLPPMDLLRACALDHYALAWAWPSWFFRSR